MLALGALVVNNGVEALLPCTQLCLTQSKLHLVTTIQ